MTTMFLTDVDFLLKFYERCIKDGIESEQDKVDLLVKMAAEEKGKCSIMQTARTKEEIVKDCAKHYNNVLYLKPENPS